VIALDASALIAYLDREDAHHDAASAALAAGGAAGLCASTVSLAEVLVGPVRSGRLDAVRLVLRELRVLPVGLEPGDEVALAELRASSGLRLPEACVLQAARALGADVLTFDHRVRHAARRLGVGIVAA